MKRAKSFDIFLFIIGLIAGFYLNLFFKRFFSENLIETKLIENQEEEATLIHHDHKNYSELHENSLVLYEHQLADKLFSEVKIFCWVFTHPANHKTKVPHVRNTWGRRCNKLLFMSVASDPEQPDIIALPVENGRAHLWNKTRLAMKYVYENHFSEADWFMRADDDNYIIMENLRHKLYQYHPQTSIYIGNRFAQADAQEGFMTGAGHIFSKKALEKFVTKISPNASLCRNIDSNIDDVFIGACLSKYAIFIDARDEKNEKQIFSFGVEVHLTFTKPNMSNWYQKMLWRNVTQGGLGCCSDTFISFTTSPPKEIYFMEFAIYHLHPFGIEKNLTETLPRKLSLDEIIKASDVKSSYSSRYKEFERVHYIDEDEKYEV